MNILFTLCGRAGSKGYENKNLKTFLNIPLVYYSIAAIDMYIKNEARKEDCIDVVLNTDSGDLIDLVTKQTKILVDVIHREASLGGDAVPKVSVIKDCMIQMETKKDKKYNMVVDFDITSPLRTRKDVGNAIEKKAAREDADVVYSVTASRRNPYFNMVKEENGYFCKAIASEYTARQQAPVFYDMNASIYAYSVEALREKEAKVFFNDKCDAILMKDTGILDIDSEEDFELMQVIARYLFDTNNEYIRLYKAALSIKESTNI
ncbi:cytidylyltransferase domain-containing protein [Holdemania filiformis]|uniref:acylneuraminate cytidylyltransferase family protein n=1 Tax=Holdemania filiformis TaxID=61171 RepID=UPI00242F3A4C|nr:hypothetical protein [Holdemania filiformis]